jgi:hypothetical protein
MRRTAIFGVCFLVLFGCSSGGEGAKPELPRGHLQIFGNIQLESEAGRGDAKKALATWQKECIGKDYLKMGVKAGTQVYVQEDDYYREVFGGVVNYSWASRYSIDEVQATQIRTTAEHKSGIVSAKVQYSIFSGETYVNKRVVEILEAPTEEIRKYFGDLSKPLRECRAKFSRPVVSVNWAKYKLAMGQQVSGIVKKESTTLENYECSTLENDGSVRETILIAKKATEQLLTFYSKDLINPLEGYCVRAPSLLSSWTVTDDNGAVVEMKKNEVTQIR